MGSCTWVVGVVVMVVVVVVGVARQGHAHNVLPVHLHTFAGPTDAQFGFSVALWNDANGVKRVVVGAPRGNQTGWGNGTFPLGVAYLCELSQAQPRPGGGGGGGGGGGEVCSIQPGLFPPSRKKQKESLLKNYAYTLKHYGMALGQTIVSQKDSGSKLIVCAPRYPMPYSDYFIGNDGMCFVLKDPAKKFELAQGPGGTAFQTSLMGFSAAIEEDKLVMGAPMAYNGCGILLSYFTKWDQYYSKMESQGGNDTLVRLKTACKDSHQGWAVQAARYKGKAAGLYVAASSPKSHAYTGHVSFFPIKLRSWDPPLHTLRGNETGAHFGYALASPDLDGDGRADLVVAAPLATGQHAHHRDAGRVFVYYNPMEDTTQEPLVLVGPEPWGRFGTSLASLGDINDDSYEDVAVGAPYMGEDGGGVVFIYNGGGEGLRHLQPKIITPAEYFPGSRGFGFSLDGGLDMDGNGYPDMVVGALHSDTAVLVRASPVVRLVGSVYFDSPAINIKENLCYPDMPGQKKLRGVCFDLNVNFTYDSKTTFDTLLLSYNMKLSSDVNGTTRFAFYHNTDRMDTLTRVVNKRDKFNPSPWGLKVFVQRARSNVNQTISASVTVKVSSHHPEHLLPPLLDGFAPHTYTTSTVLVCRNEATCSTEPDLVLNAFGGPITLGETPLTMPLNVSLEVRNDPAYGIKVKIDYPHHVTYHIVEGRDEIPVCRRHLTRNQVTCEIDEVNADEKIDFWLQFTYSLEDVHQLLGGTTFSLSVDNDVHTDTDTTNNRVEVVVTTKTNATLYTKGFAQPETFIVVVNQTASKEEVKAVQEASDGAAAAAATTFPVNKLGPRLEHIISLTNRGPSPVRNVRLKFHLPLYLGTARLTYFMDQPKPSPGVTCTPLQVNPYRLQPPQLPVSSGSSSSSTTITTTSSSFTSLVQTSEAQSQHQREKREVEETLPPLTTTSSSSSSSSSSTSPSSSRWTTDPVEYFSTTFDPVQNTNNVDENALDCWDPQCLVTCSVDQILAQAHVYVNFSSYLVTATVNQLDLRKVFLKTWVEPQILQEGSTIINPKNSATTRVVLEKPPKQGFFAVPLWILILAVVTAIVLILLIIFGLRKAGFFKRQRPPTTYKRQSLPQDSDFK